MRAKGKFTKAMLNYIRAKLSMQNVEKWYMEIWL